MLKKAFYFLAFGILLIVNQSSNITRVLSPLESELVFKRLVERVSAINTMEFTLTNYERVEGELLKGVQDVKLVSNPFQCYLKLVYPGKGEEVLYSENKNNKEAIYNPVGFPFVQLDMDPYGSLMRKNNHHTIVELGFKRTFEILKYHMDNQEFVLNVVEDVVGGVKVYNISIEFVNFGYQRFQVEQEEQLFSLANRLHLNDFMIGSLNDIDTWDDVEKGETLSIPNCYAKNIEMVINASNGLPSSYTIKDDKGVYEKYEFTNLKVNHAIPANRFKPEFLGKM